MVDPEIIKIKILTAIDRRAKYSDSVVSIDIIADQLQSPDSGHSAKTN